MMSPLTAMAVDSGQNLEKVAFKDQSWLGQKTRSRKYVFLWSNDWCDKDQTIHLW